MSFPFTPVSTPEACRCCAGDIDLYGDPCVGCQDAMLRGDRLGHPHALSPAQQTLVDTLGPIGGGVRVLDALVAESRDGRRTVIAVEEDE